MLSHEYSGFTVEYGPVARLVIDRETKRNALTRAMWEALPGLLSESAADPEVKVLLVSGAGASFSAGADISDLISGDDPADPMAEIRAANLRAQKALRDFPKPTIAVDRVFPADTLESETRAFAGTLISRSQLTIRSAKETVTALLGDVDADPTAYTRYLETISSGELTQGVTAFTQKRQPDFPWKG